MPLSPYNRMQMHPASEQHIPDGLLASIALQNEKPHLGLPSRNPALHQGIDASKSKNAMGLQTVTTTTRVRSRCTGKERDAESGNDYFEARYYESSMGRFMSPDYADEDDGPMSIPYYNPSNPQSLNLYSYGRNNPVTNTDSDGHDVQVCSTDSNGNKQCAIVSNDQYQAAQQATNAQGILNVPSLTNVGANGTSNITDSNGNTVGTATYVPDSGVDFYSNQGAYAQLSNTSRVVNAGTAIYAGAYTAAFLGPMAYTALAGGAEAEGAGLTEHAAARLAERGISLKQAQDAIEAAKKAGDVVTKMGKYGTPQSIYTANGIRVVVEQAGANAGKIITAFFK